MRCAVELGAGPAGLARMLSRLFSRTKHRCCRKSRRADHDFVCVLLACFCGASSRQGGGLPRCLRAVWSRFILLPSCFRCP